MNERLRWAGAVVLVCAPASGVLAEGAESPPADARKDEKAVAIDHHRVTLGMVIPSGLGVGTNGDAGAALGGVGGIPYATAGYEARMAGPAWFLVALRGGIDAGAVDDIQDYESWDAGATVGVRIEAPVHEYVELGGHGRFVGSLSRYATADYVQDGWRLGAEVGAGMHFRPTRLFGVRLCIDVLDWGYGESSQEGQIFGRVYAHLKASPSLDLTFSF